MLPPWVWYLAQVLTHYFLAIQDLQLFYWRVKDLAVSNYFLITTICMLVQKCSSNFNLESNENFELFWFHVLPTFTLKYIEIGFVIVKLYLFQHNGEHFYINIFNSISKTMFACFINWMGNAFESRINEGVFFRRAKQLHWFMLQSIFFNPFQVAFLTTYFLFKFFHFLLLSCGSLDVKNCFTFSWIGLLKNEQPLKIMNIKIIV